LDIVVARAGALGDVLLLRPALYALRQAGHTVTVVAPFPSARLLRDEVEDVRDWDGPGVRALLSGEPCDLGPFDGALFVGRSEDVARAFARVASVVRRVDPTPDGGHAARWYADAVEPWGAWQGVPPPLQVLPGDSGAADALLERLPVSFVSVHPGSGSPRKNWPRFAELLDRLAPETFLLVEGPADEEAAAPLRDRPGVVPSGALDVLELAAVLRHAGLHLGNDSGVSHLAAACAAPTVAVFGPTDPRTWAPVGPRVRVVHASSGDLGDVSVDAVNAAAAALR
jgi:ADP-heptose:LPS heptosyltransferase